MKAACIQHFKCCNISTGEVKISPAQAAFTIYITGIKKPRRSTSRARRHRPPSLYESLPWTTPTDSTSGTQPLPPIPQVITTPIPSFPWTATTSSNPLPSSSRPIQSVSSSSHISSSQPVPTSTPVSNPVIRVYPASQAVSRVRNTIGYDLTTFSLRRLRSTVSDNPLRSLNY